MPVQEEGLSISNDEVTEKTEAEKQRLVKGEGEAMDVTETIVDDKARIEAIIRRAMMKAGKAEMGEKPQQQVSKPQQQLKVHYCCFRNLAVSIIAKVSHHFELRFLEFRHRFMI